ncbi:MAG TPA: alpha/beta hydrolase-fold protein, partial [Anaerolineaceae bacterium]
PVREAVADPDPVEISASPGIEPGPGGHFYLQYIDLRHINPTFHAPNAINLYYGFDPADPALPDALAYTFDYSVFTPTPDLCDGKVPERLPVMIFLHGARSNRYSTPKNYIYPYCAYGVYPVDETETWYFGFAQRHDYRKDGPFAADDMVENYTEQRLLRMVYDLMRKPPGPPVDKQRVYLFGHSMGGTGSLAFAERYPNVFAAIYSGQPVTNFRETPGVTEPWPAILAVKWGPQALNLPIAIFAPHHWADRLKKYNGRGVYDWENLTSAFNTAADPGRAADEMVPFGIDHGTADDSVQFPSQGQPLYPLLNASPRAWAGAISDKKHEWSVFGWPLADFAMLNKIPFWGFSVIRDETVPGFSHLSGNETSAPTAPTTYNQTVLWSASWNAWDGAPIDTATRWRMSFCAVAAGSQDCNQPGAAPVTVDITPRRLQHFKVTPGAQYFWQVHALENGQLVARGTLTASADGLLTIPAVAISPAGVRLEIQPKK